MKPEIEVKFLDADFDALRTKLKELGAECVQPMRTMKRKNYDYPDHRLNKERNGWIRLRDEDGKITLAYKQLNDRTLEGTHEVSVAVDSFEHTDELLKQVGIEEQSYQVTRRESWRLDNFEIELDEWPWVKPYIEIEGPDEQSLRELVGKLGLDWSNAKYGSVEIAYTTEYGVTEDDINSIKDVNFDSPVPDWLAKRKKR